MSEHKLEQAAVAGGKGDKAAQNDSRIAELEQALDAEKQQSAELRSQVKELSFKLDILERSYSKQLEDQRAVAENAVAKADEQRVRLAELDAARADAIELLTDAKAEIDRLTVERQQLRRKLAADDGSYYDGPGEAMADEGTINTLLDDRRWARASEQAAAEQKVEEQKRIAEEEAVEDMISPDLVFAPGGSKD